MLDEGKKSTQIIDEKGGSLLSRVTIALFLPSLIFTNLISDLNDHDVDTFFEVLLYTTSTSHTVHVVIGIAVGWSMGCILRSTPEMKRAMALCVAFQNTTAVPLLFVQTLADNGVTSADPDFKSKGTMYVLLFTVFTSFFKWTVAYRMMIKTPPKTQNKASLSVNMLDLQSIGSDKETAIVENQSPPPMSAWETIKKTLNPPIISVIIALPLALIPHVSDTLFLKGNAVFKNNFFDAASSVGQVTSVSTLLILGVALSKGYPPGADITKWELWATVAGRLIIMPFIGMGIFMSLYNHGFCVSGYSEPDNGYDDDEYLLLSHLHAAAYHQHPAEEPVRKHLQVVPICVPNSNADHGAVHNLVAGASLRIDYRQILGSESWN